MSSEKLTVAVAVSGGADSLYSMLLLLESGHRVVAVHGRFIDNAGACPPGLYEVCQKLGVELHIFDLRRLFYSMVIKPFIQSYLAGATPNPCIHCNALIKFGLLFDAAKELGASKLATGHYASIAAHERYGFALRAAHDKGKDQSYFLSMLPRERLEQIIFPLAGLNKADIVADLQKRGIAVPVSAESQDICFVPADDYRSFIAQRADLPFEHVAGAASECAAQTIAMLPGPGPIMLLEGGVRRELGRHHGLWQYTEGQRRGLGIAHKEPLYVIGKDVAANVLLVGPKDMTMVRECLVERVNYLVLYELWPEKIYARIRYRQKNAPASIVVQGNDIHLYFLEPQSLSAPGQAAVFYDAEGCVLGGGVLTLRSFCPPPELGKR